MKYPMYWLTKAFRNIVNGEKQMNEKEPPQCPMGHKMRLYREGKKYHYECLECSIGYYPIVGWSSPIRPTPEEAYDAAMRRPMQKPLTLEELESGKYNQYTLWIEQRFNKEMPPIYPVMFQSVLANICIWFIDYTGRGRSSVIQNYGKEFVLWYVKPTDEECAAAKWEGVTC